MGGMPLTDLVGRGHELSRLDSVLGAAEGGGGATVLVGGEAGIGKSRLVSEMCARAAARGFLVAVGRGTAVEGRTLPYGQVVPILHELERRLAPAVAADVLAPALDGLGLSLTESDADANRRPLAGPFARTWLFEKLLRTFAAVAGGAPTLLVFEDVHWADPGTLAMIEFVTRNLTETRLVIACTYRSDEVDPNGSLGSLLVELRRVPHVHALDLGGLDDDNMTSLVTLLLGRRPDEALVRALGRRSGGNPFFVEELLASGPPSEWSRTLKAAVAGRLSGVSGTAGRILDVASALGAPLDDRVLRELAGLGDEVFDGAVRECLDRNLLVVASGAEPGYEFRHDLVREAVYDRLLPGPRTRIHRLIAETLRSRMTSSAVRGHADAELAGHWWAAGEWEEALRSSVAAADAACDVFAFEEATLHLEHALVCADELGDANSDVDRASLLERAADAAYLAGGGQRSVELARAVVEILDPDADPLRAAMGYVLLARNQWALADPAASLASLAAAEALIPPDPPSRELARALAEKGRCLMLMARYREGESVCRRGHAAARAVGARSEESHILASLGICVGALRDRDEGIGMLKEAVRIAEELGSPEDMGRGYSNLTAILYSAGHLEEVAELAVRSSSEGEDIAGIRLQTAALNGADALIDLGRWEDAEAIAARVVKAMGNCGYHPGELRALVAIRRGRLEEAKSEMAVILQSTEKLEDVQTRGKALLQSAEIAVAEGRYFDGYDLAEQALSMAAGTDDMEYLPEMCALGARALADALHEARAAGRRHDPVKIRLLANQLAQQVHEVGERAGSSGAGLTPRAAAFSDQCRAEVTRLDGSDPNAWSLVAEKWKALHHPFETAYCQWREAEALLARREKRARAAELLRSAWRTCSTLGAAPLGSRVEELAQRARVPLESATEAERQAAEVAANLGITARELEVLGCLASGKTDAQIAEALFISKKTASVHVSNLLRKLDAGSRYEAAEIGRREGLPIAR